MAIESLFLGATLRDRFIAAASRDDEAAASRLAPFIVGSDSPEAQRSEAWELLSGAIRWTAKALDTAGVSGTDARPIRDSESAFERAQHLERQSWELSQRRGFHDSVALLVDAVRRACYAGAELGPIPGGRLAAIRHPSGPPSLVRPISPRASDLQDVGSGVGEALRRYAELELGDLVEEATASLQHALP